MLGNFSFGDYFKKEAIVWAWEFLTEVLSIPKDKLWITIYLDDDEAGEIWHKVVGIQRDRIIRLGKEDNFWEMGEVGPCGPCSEIMYDQGEEVGCGRPDCNVSCDCDRFVELWNLVFTQFDKLKDGTLQPLPKKNIDTGMGLERLAAVVQGVTSNFDTDLFRPIINYIASLKIGVVYGRDSNQDISLKVIADHIRAAVFLIYDSVIPSNEGRGYVLRLLIRRSLREGKKIGLPTPFLYKVVNVTIQSFGQAEVLARSQEITKVVKMEEERFLDTLESGSVLLDELISSYKERGERVLSGRDAFKLYDTYGFPVSITEEILRDSGMELDHHGFNQEMECQRRRSRQAFYARLRDEVTSRVEGIETEFVGYERFETETTIEALILDGESVEEANKDEYVMIALNPTPFYGEAGGQIGDTGEVSGDGLRISITGTRREGGNIILCEGKVKEGIVRVGDRVLARIDIERRRAASRSHTATHLLQAALRQVVGGHVKQSGSFVGEDRLRFDFTHLTSLTRQELGRVEEVVNEKIRENLLVETYYTTLDEAKAQGAIALFEDEYGVQVRVVKLGDFSIELCGGTHVARTGELGLFKLLSESGISAGVRRIEALTGEAGYKFFVEQVELLDGLGLELKVDRDRILPKVSELIAEKRRLEQEVSRLHQDVARSKASEFLEGATQIQGVTFVKGVVHDFDNKGLLSISDIVLSRIEGIVVLGSKSCNRVNVICKVSRSLASRISARDIIKEIADIIKGGGGGRKELAQAGGRAPERLDEALERALAFVKERV
jgi:alanyl-tRNA synthetase